MHSAHIRHYWAAVILATGLLLPSCGKSDGMQDPLEIKFAVQDTRSTDTSFENGDELSLFAGSPVNATNVKMVYRNGYLVPQTPVCWEEGQTGPTTFDVLYPYLTDWTSASLTSFTVLGDQSSKASFNASDLMTARKTAVPEQGTVVLSFSHRLAKLEISVTNTIPSATVHSVSVSGVKLSYDFKAGSATGQAGTVFAYPVSDGSKYAVIIAPQSVRPVINVTLSDGNTYVFKCTDTVLLEPGSRNDTAITVSSDDPVIDTPVTTRPWFEMPAIADEDRDGQDDDDPNLYYAYHSFSNGGRKMRNYSICYSAEHHCAMWMAAPRHRCYEGSSGRSDAYRQDPDIPSSIQYSSKDTGGGCNKGHLLGSAERTCCTDANKQVFYYTNIAPQYSSGYNTGGGGWNILEDYIDGLVCSDTLYEVVGCYFEPYKDGYGYSASPKVISFGGRNDVDLPTMFYYAVLRTKSGKTGKPVSKCSASELKCVAFVRSHNNSLKGVKPSAKEMMSIADLEKLTGFKYFVNVPNAPKDTFNPNEW